MALFSVLRFRFDSVKLGFTRSTTAKDSPSSVAPPNDPHVLTLQPDALLQLECFAGSTGCHLNCCSYLISSRYSVSGHL